MNPNEVDVLVIGGGVGGLATALAFAQRHDLTVRVVERRSGPGNINRGDSLLPAVTRHFVAWGAMDRVMAAGANPVDRMQVFHARGGMLLEAPLTDPDGSPYVVLPHPEIERVLADAARATGRVTVSFRTSLRRLLEEDGRVCGAVIVGPQGEEEVRARLVIGADGSESKLRGMLGVPFVSAPYDTGYYIVDLQRPRGYRDAMRLDLHADGGVMTMPQRPGVVGVAVLVSPHQLQLFQSGTMEARLETIWERAPLLQGMGCVNPKAAHLYRLHRGHATRYIARGAALIGDAAHLTNPTAGQGMTMAIEDGAALARLTAHLLAARSSQSSIDLALLAYESERQPANRELVRWSHWMGRFFSAPGAMADTVRRRVFAFGRTSLGQLIQRRVWRHVATRKAS